MVNENNLGFIKDRIGEIRSAILHSMSNELIKIPSSIITVLRADENGHLWFFIKKPVQVMFDHEKSFPVRLQFYRKGKPFYIHVTGYAEVSDNNEVINEFTNLEKDIAMQNLMLIKLKMTKIEYHEQKHPEPERFGVQHFFQRLYSSLFKPAGHYHPFELNTEIV